MIPIEWVFIIRGVERILIVVAGIICIYLGYLLFVKGVSGEASIKAQKSNVKFQLSNAAPGIFFALFGALILCVTIGQSVIVEDSEEQEKIRFCFFPEVSEKASVRN